MTSIRNGLNFHQDQQSNNPLSYVLVDCGDDKERVSDYSKKSSKATVCASNNLMNQVRAFNVLSGRGKGRKLPFGQCLLSILGQPALPNLPKCQMAKALGNSQVSLSTASAPGAVIFSSPAMLVMDCGMRLAKGEPLTKLLKLCAK